MNIKLRNLLMIGSIVTSILISSCTKKEDKDEPLENTSTFTDSRDGKVYKSVKIGEQVWMAENLAYKPNSGNYWAYRNIENNASTYGYLYDWETALNVCPNGWHLPTKNEWEILINHLGGEDVAGGKMKETGTAHWNSSNVGATNSSGFSALPGGYEHSCTGISFVYLHTQGFWWSATSTTGSDIAWYRNLSNYSEGIHSFLLDKRAYGMSVRCVKD